MLKIIVMVIAILMSAFHLYAGAFGAPQAMMHRSIHLLFTLVLIFLVGMAGEKKQSRGKIGCDILLLFLTFLSLGYIFLNYEDIVTRYPYVQALSLWDFWMGVILTLLLLEASRRVIGWALPITAVVFLLYAMFGNYLPGLLRHTGFPMEMIIDQLYLTTEGIFGIPLGVSATYVILFVICDGDNWSLIPHSTIPLANLDGLLMGGLAVTSRNENALGTATFDRLIIGPSSGMAAQTDNQSKYMVIVTVVIVVALLGLVIFLFRKRFGRSLGIY